ncbi:MAG: hypothetical protein ACRD12_09370 [Acidimicrobiales bacterium]
MDATAGGRDLGAHIEALAISRAEEPEEVAVFEAATYANAGALDSYVAGSVHLAPATAALAELHLLVGRKEGTRLPPR